VPFPFRHVHLAVTVPWTDEDHPVSGLVRVPYRVFSHGNVGRLQLVKWQDDRGGDLQTLIDRPLSLIGPDDEFQGVLEIDCSDLANSGWRLFRFYAVWEHLNGNRQVARPICPVFVANGKPRSDEASTWWRPTAWYQEDSLDWGYAIAAIDRDSYRPLTAKQGIWRPVISLGVNEKGDSPPVTGYSVHLDPDFHAGDEGRVIEEGRGSGEQTLGIDTSRLTRGAR
jgi:hypothetical protein